MTLIPTFILPKLQKVIKKREADITPIILKALLRDDRFSSCAIEIKQCAGRTLGARALLPHQRNALLRASGLGMYHKISDVGRVLLPFDAFMLKGAGAWVVIYYRGVRPAECWALDIAKMPLGALSLSLARELGLRVTL